MLFGFISGISPCISSIREQFSMAIDSPTTVIKNVLEFIGYTYPYMLFAVLISCFVFFLAFLAFPIAISYIGTYSGFDRPNRSKIIEIGEILICYFLLTLPVALTVLSLIQFEYNEKRIIIFLGVVIAFLVSLRLLANPTKTTLKYIFWIKNTSYLTTREIEQIKLFRERVLSFYLSLIEGATFILLISLILIPSFNQKFSDITNLVCRNPIGLIAILGSYSITLILSTILCEIILKWWEPIDIDAISFYTN